MKTIKEVAEIMGKSLPAIYKMLREQRLVGQHFFYLQGKGYRCSLSKEDIMAIGSKRGKK